MESQTTGCSYTHGCETGTLTVTYSDEYTTAMLKDYTVAALPAYDEDYNDTCSAFRSLSSDETSYTIRRLKYKFTFSAPAAADCLIEWNEHFVPASGGSPTDTPRSASVTTGDTETSVLEITEGTVNGTTTITDVTCTLV